jgi:hypothetical protein
VSEIEHCRHHGKMYWWMEGMWKCLPQMDNFDPTMRHVWRPIQIVRWLSVFKTSFVGEWSGIKCLGVVVCS